MWNIEKKLRPLSVSLISRVCLSTLKVILGFRPLYKDDLLILGN